MGLKKELIAILNPLIKNAIALDNHIVKASDYQSSTEIEYSYVILWFWAVTESLQILV